MVDELTYKIAKCCSPDEKQTILGYFKDDGSITVHDASCITVAGLRPERLLDVTWDEIHTSEKSEIPLEIPAEIDETDYYILKHHQEVKITPLKRGCFDIA